jgi:apolipoprotein N-acyltransferase
MTNITLSKSDMAHPASRQTLTIAAVWLGLIAATCLSWWLGSEHRMLNARVASSVIILVTAFIKIRFVGNYFMELRDAPIPMRVFFEAYCVGICSIIIAIYLWG